MAKLPMMGTAPLAGMGRGKPGAPTQNAAGAMGQRRLRSAAMIGRTAREGMNSPAVMPRKTPVTPPGMAGSGVTPSQFMPSRAPLKPAQSRGAPGGPGYSSTPNYMPSSARIARNKQEGAARINAMSPMARLSQNAPKFKG